jgi:hypothetical protein
MEHEDNLAPEANNYDEFTDAFDALLDKGSLPDADAAVPPAVDAVSAETAATEILGEPAAAAAAIEDDSAASDIDTGTQLDTPPVQAEPDTQVPATPPAVDWEARFKELERQRAEAAPAAEVPPAAAAATPEMYNATEKEFLEQYEEDWPDITKGEALKRRAEYQQLVTHVFNEISRVYGPMVSEAYNAAQTLSEDKTLDIIRTAHQDYDQIYDKVIAWADTLPSYMKSGAKEVIASGSPEAVVELIADFKKAAGVPQATSAPKPTQLSDKAKQAATALSVVNSKRTVVATVPDAADFDAAWSEANAGGK